MNHMATSPDRARDFVRAIMDYYETYHHHKEVMAYAGLTLYAGAVGTILLTDHWPPLWFMPSATCRKYVAGAALFLVFLLAMLFVSWQLRLRRLAAQRQAGAQRLLARWITDDPSERDLRSWKPPVHSHRMAWFLKFLWPPLAPTPRPDIPYEQYPAALARFWFIQERAGRTGARAHEHLMSAAMWLLFALSVLRTLA